jgi:hypothetical protein
MSDLEAEFQAYDALNPRVYELVKRFAYQAVRAGYSNFSIAMIWERIRWEIAINTHSNVQAADFKMPNNHRAYYARKFLREHPQYPGFFRIAHLRSKGAIPVDRYGVAKDDSDDWVVHD